MNTVRGHGTVNGRDRGKGLLSNQDHLRTEFCPVTVSGSHNFRVGECLCYRPIRVRGLGVPSNQIGGRLHSQGWLSGAVVVFHFYAPIALSLRRAGEEDAENLERGRRW